MVLWQAWLSLLEGALHTLAIDWGLGAGVAIVVLTLGVRVMLMPLTWTLAYRGALRQARLAKLAPQVDRIRERHADDPAAQLREISQLYRAHDVRLADGKSLLGGLVQLPVIYGLYSTLRDLAGATRFLWIRDLGRPDVLLAIAAAVTTAVTMAVAPHVSEQMRVMMIVLSTALCFTAAMHFSAGLALYWITSNLVSTAQTLALRYALRRLGAGRQRGD